MRGLWGVRRIREWLSASMLAAVLGIGLGFAAPLGAQEASSERSAVYQLVERHFEQTLAIAPLSATWIGDSRYDDQLGNPDSLETRARFDLLDRQSLLAARAIARDALSPADALTLDIFINAREQQIDARRFPEHLLPITQLDSLPIELALLGSGDGQQPLATLAQHRAWLARAAQFPRWVDTALANLREGVVRQVTLPRVAAERVLPQLRAIADSAPGASVFHGALKRIPASATDAERAALTADYEALIVGQLLPAYRKLADYFANEYIPACRSSVGWSALPDGTAWYRARVRANTGLELSPDEIHAIGLKEVARIQREMESVRRAIGFSGDQKAFRTYLATDPRFYHTSADGVVEGFKAIKRKVDPNLPALFSLFPKADYEVRPVEAFRAAAAPGAFYQSPSQDGSRPGIFYINTNDLRAVPIWGMETLSLHEAAPGHHFQIALAQEVADLPRFRRFFGDNAYAEGWALYAETLGHDLGLFTDPLQWFGKLNDEMLRASRLVVDTGLHAKGWSRERAIAYMKANQVMADSDAVIEVERYMVDPGQALGYKLGQLRILQLRREAESQLKARFDLRAFHRELLVDGAMPLPVLERKIRRWIAAQGG
ncbi:DUF885 domain-containing protein [Niveibacterium sp. 24ML]|uniref:DUF885 domain-containing protein n=1 Tax=Niveibacterium sp. 24ML TaxID=2985512 RepID=UPI002271489B|nr:DUF885 domain-containing protein [Niveibacterium sp. 24ML]MCX9155376.1 DUF885 domain-containing protein [Niveibacterium sp. 24ML]